MSTTDQSILQTLLMAKADCKQLVPIVGAGTSMPLGSPSWKTLIERLIQNRNLGAETLDSIDPPDALKAIKEQIGPASFTTGIQNALKILKNSTTTALQALVNTNISRIITTNLDYSIEIAFQKAGRPIAAHNVCVGYSIEELTLFSGRGTEETKLLKMHGSLERPSTWVLTSDDYNKAYIDPGTLKDFISNNISIPLFIGFSFSDFDISYALRIATYVKLKKAYTIVHIDTARKLETKFRNLGIIPIIFFKYDQIPEIIDEVFTCSTVSIESRETRLKELVYLRIGGAEIKTTKEFDQSLEKRERLISIAANALEIQPNKSEIDNRPRRTFGLKGQFLDEFQRLLREKNEELVKPLLSLFNQYPEIIFETLTPIILSIQEIDHYYYLQLFFQCTPDSESLSKSMEQYLLFRLHSEQLGYKCLRAIGKVLASRHLHPAMQIPPLTIQISNLDVSIYPLTRYQAGVLLNDEALKSSNPIRPFTLESFAQIEELRSRLSARTGKKWRLPTKQEWRLFAGLERGHAWPWGADDPVFKIHAHLNYLNKGQAAKSPLEVGVFPIGVSKEGIHDLIGNVYEVVTESPANRFGPTKEKTEASIIDGGSGANEVALAGGSWTTAFKTTSRFVHITRWGKGEKNNVGLRFVCEIIK